MSALNKLSDLLDVASRVFAGVLVIGLSTLTFVGVIFRFILNSPIQWLYETSIIFFTWVIFLGTAMAFKRSEHIHISFLLTKMGPRLRFFWEQLIYIICIAFLVIGFKDSIGIVQGTWGQLYNTIPVSKGIFYLSFSVGSILSIVHILAKMFSLRINKMESKEEFKQEVEEERMHATFIKGLRSLPSSISTALARR